MTMMTRRTALAACGAAGVILLTGGFWGGRSLTTSAATPRIETGKVVGVGVTGEEFAIELAGSRQATGFGLGSDVLWRDPYGTWHDGTSPTCMRPLSRGQRVTIGVIDAQPLGDAPGRSVVVWLECARKPVIRYPVVTPSASGSPHSVG
jgi:hypothetical protein